MKSSVTLGRPLGIQVGAHWSLFVFALLAVWSLASGLEAGLPGYPTGTYWVTGGLVVALFIGGLVLHELAHAAVARRYGIEVDRITLWILGGMAELKREAPTPGSELLIAGAGPMASLGVAAALFGAAVAVNAATDARVLINGLAWLAFANAVLAVFNLLPARPLDGGRVLTGALWAITKDRERATVIAAKVSSVVGLVLLSGGIFVFLNGAFAGLWLALIGWMVVTASGAERRLQQWRTAMAGLRFRDVMSAPPPSVPAWTTVHDLVADMGRRPSPVYLIDRGDGRPVGILTAVAASRAALSRGQVMVGELAQPVDDSAVASPDEEVSRVLGSRVLMLPVMVRDAEGHVLGQVRVEDLSQPTRPPPARAGTPWPPPRVEERVGA